MWKFRDVSMMKVALDILLKKQIHFVLWLWLFSGLLLCPFEPAFAQSAPQANNWQVLMNTLFNFMANDNDRHETGEENRPRGWSETTHGSDAEPNYDIVFADSIVKRMDIKINSAGWDDMIASIIKLFGEKGTTVLIPDLQHMLEMLDPNSEYAVDWLGFPKGNPNWRPCTVKFEGKIWNSVGFRFKGNSSLDAAWRMGSLKLPFRLDFDRYEDEYPAIKNQRFYGFDELAMSSNYTDSTYIREKVVADIFRDAGVPAPRTAFYRVFINYGHGPEYFGLYTMCEIPDDPMLESQFSDSGGNLYKPDGRGANFFVYNEAAYVKKTNKKDADFSDVKALFDALHADREDPSVWRSGLEAVLDVDGFLRWLAVNTTVVNWDTYGTMPHNYYLYNDPGDNLLHWIPWDNNMSMMVGMRGMLSVSLWEVGNRWPLIRFLLDDPVYHRSYVAHVKEFITTIFYPDRMQSVFTAEHELVRPYTVGEQGELEGHTLLSDKERFESMFQALIEHVETRYNMALAFVAANE